MSKRPATQVPPLQNLNRNPTEHLPAELVLMIRNKLLDSKLPGQVCAEWNAWCRAAKSTHSMCSNPNDLAWKEGCKLLGLDDKPTQNPERTWRAIFNALCDELFRLKDAAHSRGEPWVWYTWLLEERAASGSPQARGAVWLRRCAAQVLRIIRFAPRGTYPHLLSVLRQYDTSTSGYEAVTQGYEADSVLTQMPPDPNTSVPTPPSLDALRDAYRHGMNVNAFKRGDEMFSRVSGLNTVLYRAVHWGHTYIVEWLLSVGADPNLRESDRKWTPLMEARREHNYDIMVLLLDNGADVNAERRNDDPEEDDTALSQALRGFSEWSVELLLDAGANPHMKMRFNFGDERHRDERLGIRITGRTALMFACYLNNRRVITALIAAGADVNARDDQGQTVLMVACEGYADKVVIEELIAAGAEVNSTDPQGKTALMVAADDVKVYAIDALSAAGANVGAVDLRGRSAFEYARASLRGRMFPQFIDGAVTALQNAGAAQEANSAQP